MLESGTSVPEPLVVRSFPDGRDLYRVLRPVEGGSGSEGHVSVAVDVSSGEQVALKQFLFDLGSDSGTVQQLADRLEKLRALSLTLQDVPGLVRYLPAFRGFAPSAPHAPPPAALEATPSQAYWYLPMGLVAGTNLAVHIDDGLTAEQVTETLAALESTAQALDRLASLTSGPLVHRDVRPANIMMRRVPASGRGIASGGVGDGGTRLQAVLVDLGLITRQDKTTVSSAGALGYMAPEVLDGKPISPRQAHLADWYSFYATVAAVLIGHAPPSSPDRWGVELRKAQLPPATVKVVLAAATAAAQDRPSPTVFLRDVRDTLTVAGPDRRLLLVGSVLTALVAAGAIIGVLATQHSSSATAKSPTSGSNGQLIAPPTSAPSADATPTGPVPGGSPKPAASAPGGTVAPRPTAATGNTGTGGGSRTVIVTRTITAAPTAGTRTVTRTSSAPKPVTSPKPIATQAPQQQTVAETTGGVTHTWTDYTSAGGTQGPSIQPQVTVQVSCRRTGFQVSDGNTWWYRIASSPWNNTYWASADAFYNNGATSGSLSGTPFYDPNVPNC